MEAEISYDLIMDEEMPFVEGCYRIAGGEWHVIIASRKEIENTKVIPQTWLSAVTGFVIHFPMSGLAINRMTVQYYLSQATGVSDWVEVRGPDSIQIR